MRRTGARRSSRRSRYHRLGYHRRRYPRRIAADRTSDLSPDELDALATAAAGGDTGALNRLLAAIAPRALRTCGRVLPNPSDAEEAAQDALLAVSRRISSFDGRARFTTWFHAVANNAAIDTYRRLKRRAAEQGSDAELELVASDARTSVVAGARVDLLDALEQVDPRFGEAVVLRDVHGLDYGEIAVVLDVPVGTVKSRIHEGRRTLQYLLDRDR